MILSMNFGVGEIKDDNSNMQTKVEMQLISIPLINCREADEQVFHRHIFMLERQSAAKEIFTNRQLAKRFSQARDIWSQPSAMLEPKKRFTCSTNLSAPSS